MIAISFLGTGDYQKCKYLLNNNEVETEYFAYALCKTFKPEQLFLVLTEEAKAKHSDQLSRVCKYKEIIIPFGKSEQEIWKIFDLFFKKIPANKEIVLDITHGFRSQPLIAVSVVLFLRTLKNISIQNILYGAFEAKDNNNIVPVFDLKPFIDIIDWSFATEQFITYGNARNLRNIIQDIHKTTHLLKLEHKSKSLNKFGKILDELTLALSVIRPEEVCKISKELPEIIENVKMDIANIPQVSPLGGLLEKIPNAFSQFAFADDDLFSEKGFIAQAEMIKFYLLIENFQQAITLSRESVVSKVCIELKLIPTKKEDREKAESQLYEWFTYYKKGFLLKEEYALCAELWGGIIDIRNDINHAGMRKSASPTKALIENIKNFSQQTIDFLHANQPL